MQDGTGHGEGRDTGNANNPNAAKEGSAGPVQGRTPPRPTGVPAPREAEPHPGRHP